MPQPTDSHVASQCEFAFISSMRKGQSFDPYGPKPQCVTQVPYWVALWRTDQRLWRGVVLRAGLYMQSIFRDKSVATMHVIFSHIPVDDMRNCVMVCLSTTRHGAMTET